MSKSKAIEVARMRESALILWPGISVEHFLAAIAAIDELSAARAVHAPIRGAHEGYAVLLEEVKDRRRNLRAMRGEAIQVAAMAIAFAAEVCQEETAR